MKKRKDPVLNLIDLRNRKSPSYIDVDFKIESLKNSIHFQAGDTIKTKVVEELIGNGWSVNIRQAKNSDF